MKVFSFTDNPNQDIRVRINQIQCLFFFQFNKYTGYWYFTVFENNEDCPVVAGRLLVTGFDLLAEFAPELGQMYLVNPAYDTGKDKYYSLIDGDDQVIIIQQSEIDDVLSEGGLDCGILL